jgi:Spy/CpxP family protein refolding chaperone
MHKKIIYHFLGLILAITASATLAAAQPPNGGRGGGFQEQFYQVKRKQLGPELGVSQQVVDQLLQIEQRYQAQRQRLFRESRADFQNLLQTLSQPAPSEQNVKAILDNIKRKQQEKHNLQVKQSEEEERLLTPVQEARKIMYQKRLLREARSVKRKGQGEAAPMAPPTGPREVMVARKAESMQAPADSYREIESTPDGQQTQLITALKADKQTVAQLLQIRQRYRPLRQQLIVDAKNEFNRLEQVMRQPHPANQEVKNILANIKKKEQEMQELKQRQDEEELAILTPVQQARYLVYLIGQGPQTAQDPRGFGPPAASGVSTKPAGNAATGMPSRPGSPAGVMGPPDQPYAPTRQAPPAQPGR